VIDASVGIQLFVDEPHSELASRMFAGLAADPPADLHVPDLFFIECANILWKYTRRFGRPLEDGLADLADLGRLALRVTASADLMEDALALAVKTGLTAYDACYAVLAQRLGAPLVTSDEALVKAIPWAVWLGDLDASW
jgi:predicted nucleic acid-binding protein